MRVLILEQTNELAELLGIYLASLSGAEVTATHLADEAMRSLSEGDFDVFMCELGFTRPGNDLVLRTWRERFPKRAVVYLGDGTVPESESYRVGHLYLVQELRELVKAPFWRQLEGKPQGTPLPLSPYLVYRLGICPTDLFLKLGEDNWVKLFHKGSPFGEEERSKFEAKGLKEFWVLPEDIGHALGHFEDLLTAVTADSTDAALISDATEFVWHMVQECGFREDVQKVVRQAMHQSLAVIRNNPDLRFFMERILRPEHGWLVKHSMITSHVSCAVAAHLGWTSEQTFLKLTMAALMHDMLLPQLDVSEDVWVEAISGNRAQAAQNPEMKMFLQHPLEGAQLLRRFKDIPPDTDKIVLEHHERPEGDGFPRGLSGMQISPLGCLFIVAHSAAEVMLREPFNVRWRMSDLIQAMLPERWQSGNFKKIWQSFEKTDLFGARS